MAQARDSAAHGGHRERMRQRVNLKGYEGMEPHEIIEFLLFYIIPRQDVNELAHRLIDRFGSVGGVLRADLPELEDVPGVGARTARWLALLGEVVSSSAQLSITDRVTFGNYLHAFNYADRVKRTLQAPCCIQLCLDRDGRLLYRRKICDSLSWGEPETLREALGDMLSSQASSAILLLFSDHPMEPQTYDVEHAAAYADTLRAAGCDLLDVIFVGEGEHISMNRRDLIAQRGLSEENIAMREGYLRLAPEKKGRKGKTGKSV